MPRFRIALATCAILPEPDPDHEPLVRALRSTGVETSLLAWDDPAARVDGADLCLLRSTWNYPEAPEAFLAWLDALSRRRVVLNPPGLVRWNIHKGHLAQLASQGVAVAPTMFVAKGQPVDLAAAAREQRWDDIVIKPAVSAASFRTQRFQLGATQQAQAFLDALTRETEDALQRITDEQDARTKGILDDAADKMEERRKELADARRKLDEAIEEARQRREDAESEESPGASTPRDRLDDFDDLLAGAGEAVARRVEARGTFNALTAQGLASGSDAIDRTARASEQTARNTRRPVESARSGGLTFG